MSSPLETTSTKAQTVSNRSKLVFDLLLVLILVIAAYFRFAGLLWGEYQYLHPDERFLVWVGSDIRPVQSLTEYFDTANSSLNPNNRGHGFYVYGTLPMFAARYLSEWIYGGSGFAEMTRIGRVLSASMDLLAVLLVFMVARKLFNKRVGLLAAAFSAANVLQIQQSHFFTMDIFANTLALLAIYFGVKVMKTIRLSSTSGAAIEDSSKLPYASEFLSSSNINKIKSWLQDPVLLPNLGFGVALGMAVASKLNTAPVAVILPIATLIGLFTIPPQTRQRRAYPLFVFMVFAAITSLIVFRLLQPYAFSGPGFFGLKPNPQWVANIRELLAQSNGNVDFPPAMQWARRSVWFSAKNLILWGFGLPLGILTWVGFVWAGWRFLFHTREYPGEWKKHSLIWVWTGAYFIWQSTALNPTMRYQLPIYPTLAIFAAWAIIALYDLGKSNITSGRMSLGRRQKFSSYLLGGIVLLATFTYAYGFTSIYTHPITRIEATRWIYQNIPGPVTLSIKTDTGVTQQPLPFPYSLRVSPGVPYNHTFSPSVSGELYQIELPRVTDTQFTQKELTINISISQSSANDQPLGNLSLADNFTSHDPGFGKSYVLNLEKPIHLEKTQSYNIHIGMPGEQSILNVDGEVSLRLQPGLQSPTTQPVDLAMDTRGSDPTVLTSISTTLYDFVSPLDGFLTHIHVDKLSSQNYSPFPKTLTLKLTQPEEIGEPSVADLIINPDPSGQGYLLALKPGLPVYAGRVYVIDLGIKDNSGAIRLSGEGIASEGDWDDNLPFRIDGFDGYGGLYPHDLTFNMYWDDSPEKLERITRILDEATYITISSSRQWGSLTRLPERFPMTTLYYRELIGCPPDEEIETCYNQAQPGTYKGRLGFELIKTFQSNPRIGNLEINDQPSEEAFTVYDHPKVFIFKKTNTYNSEIVYSLLSSVDFSQIIRIPPMQTDIHPANLLLPDYLLAQQRRGGTWSQLFDTASIINRFPWLAALLWYVCLTLLGWIVYPILRYSLPGLADKGFPLSRTAGMILLAYLVWVAGLGRSPFSRPTISIILLLLLITGGFLAYQQRVEIFKELHSKKKYFLTVEGLFLIFFVLFLLVRYGNPDLWHPWKGGEKPMDFSYFNAILKSTVFPPYDPWYADGYLNYYYFGFVIAGVLVKWLGIVPSIAYNLLLPTFFSLIAMGGFSIVWNIFQASRKDQNCAKENLNLLGYLSAISGALGIAVLGNFGSIRMIFQGYQRLVAPGGIIDGASLLTRWAWAIQGFWKVFTGEHLPYSLGDWYWIPSRAIPAPGDVEPITEFPFFTVLYGDLHAHLLALPVTLFVLTLMIALIFGRTNWPGKFSGIIWLILTALATGALRPTNTWDFPPYLALVVVAIVYTFTRYYQFNQQTKNNTSKVPRTNSIQMLLEKLPPTTGRAVIATLTGLLFVALSFFLFQPFTDWYALGYTKINIWKGTHTPFSSYLTHWGLFLFVIIIWMFRETVTWMAETPVSALRKLRPYIAWVQIALALLLASIFILQWMKVSIAWFVLLIAAWAGTLLFNPKLTDAKRVVLFLVGTGLVLTLMVEVIVLVGDIGRMNTVFKFYLQVWTLFSLSSAAALAWTIQNLDQWSPNWRRTWQIVLVILVASTSLYPLLASAAKIKDRITEESPHSLDGMAYMPYSTYTDAWGEMDLNQDYQAIRWLQENVIGSPVIVEANLRNLYRWGSRMSIYTGLPGVVGWEWHQQQQRTATPGSWVTNRILEIDDFYLTTDWDAAQKFLRKYNVQFIILGQQERGHYPGVGLDKFDNANGILWKEVFRYQDTIIYQVIAS